MNVYKITQMLIMLMGLVWFLVPLQVVAERQLIFGIYASDKSTTMVKKIRPFLNRLQQDLGKRLGETNTLKMKVTNSYAEGVKNIVGGRVDITRLGPVSYIEAKNQNPELMILAMEAKKGKKQFNGVICLHEDSSTRTLDDIHGKRLCVLVRFANVTRPWVARAGLDVAMVRALQESLLSMSDATALKSLRKDGFLSGTDSGFDEVRIAIMQNADFFEEA